MLDISKLTQELMDSQRFNTLVAAMGSGWKKRALTDKDRARLLEPIVAMMLAKMDVQQAPSKQAMRVEQQRAPMAMGGFAEAERAKEELGFDPFVEQSAQEPNPVTVREQQFAGMKALLAASGLNPGQNKTVIFPLDWNANDAQVFFNALGGEYVLGPKGVELAFPTDETGGLNTQTGGRLEPKGWRVDVIRQR